MHELLKLFRKKRTELQKQKKKRIKQKLRPMHRLKLKRKKDSVRNYLESLVRLLLNQLLKINSITLD
jgi:hypothetical protein